MIIFTVLFYAMCLATILSCLIIVLLGAIWIINYELKELTGIDYVRKWMERRNV